MVAAGRTGRTVPVMPRPTLPAARLVAVTDRGTSARTHFHVDGPDRDRAWALTVAARTVVAQWKTSAPVPSPCPLLVSVEHRRDLTGAGAASWEIVVDWVTTLRHLEVDLDAFTDRLRAAAADLPAAETPARA